MPLWVLDYIWMHCIAAIQPLWVYGNLFSSSCLLIFPSSARRGVLHVFANIWVPILLPYVNSQAMLLLDLSQAFTCHVPPIQHVAIMVLMWRCGYFGSLILRFLSFLSGYRSKHSWTWMIIIVSTGARPKIYVTLQHQVQFPTCRHVQYCINRWFSLFV